MWQLQRGKRQLFGTNALIIRILVACLLTVTAYTSATASSAELTVGDAQFNRAVAALAEGSFDDKAQAADHLATLAHERVEIVLEAMLQRNLFTRRADRLVVIAESTDGGYEIAAAATGEPQGVVGRREARRISSNNALRAHLRGLLARLKLTATDPDTRREALSELMTDADATSLGIIRDRLSVETDSGVLTKMRFVIAVDDLRSGSTEVQLRAIETLSDSVDPAVRQALTELTQPHADPELSASAQAALRRIDGRLSFYSGLENLFFGLSLGSVLVLAAIGLSITFGVMGVINMAHGELIMLGAYTAYVFQLLMPDSLALALLLSIPGAFLISGTVGILIERGVIRFLYGRPLETLLATFGISLILQQLVRSVFSPLNRAVATPEFLSGSIEITQGLSLTSNRASILLFTLLLFAALLFLLNRTRFGLEVRAVAQNRDMARAMGVRSDRVDALTFGLGSGIAGIAGVALSQLTNVGPNLGQAYIVDSFLVVVFGGVGNLWGTLVAGMSMGVMNKFLEPFTGAVMAKILVLVMIIAFIQKRPRGLFPQVGRAVDG